MVYDIIPTLINTMGYLAGLEDGHQIHVDEHVRYAPHDLWNGMNIMVGGSYTVRLSHVS